MRSQYSIMLVTLLVAAFLVAPASHAGQAPAPGYKEGIDTADGAGPIEDIKARSMAAQEKLQATWDDPESHALQFQVAAVGIHPDGGLGIRVVGSETEEVYRERVLDYVGHDVKISSFIVFWKFPVLLDAGDNADKTSDDAGDGLQTAKNLAAYKKIAELTADPLFLSDVPVGEFYLDDALGVLVVGVEGPESREVYESRIRGYVGTEAVVQVSVAPVPAGKDDPIEKRCVTLRLDCNPMYGGIQIAVPYAHEDGTVGDSYGTLAIGAVDRDGTVGFVTAGHVAGDVGTAVGQPSTSAPAGETVNNPPLDGRDSDSAFVSSDGSKEISVKIRDPGAKAHHDVAETADPTIGATVQKTGRTSGTTSGTVLLQTNATFWDGPTHSKYEISSKPRFQSNMATAAHPYMRC